ncbi:MAG TPA: hypothetical protein VFS20_10825 [Longimicrobium sp.]|nr:hypothetical protein [Longimicrobium sp.]
MSIPAIRPGALLAAGIITLAGCGNDYTRVEGEPPGQEEKLPAVVPPRDPGANTDAGGPVQEVLSAPDPSNSAVADTVPGDSTP